MAAEDVNGLFLGSAAPSDAGQPESKRQKTGDKRVKLWPIETMACQGLNPYGPAQISVAPLEDVWKAASTPHEKNRWPFTQSCALPKRTVSEWG